MKRRILVVIVADGVEQPQWILVPKATELPQLLSALLGPEARGSAGEGTRNPEDFHLFDWHGHRLPADIRVGEIPQPGIVIAALAKSETGQKLSMSAETEVWMFRQTLMLDETSQDRLTRFLSSPDATVAALPMKQIDVFVSYSFEDGSLAAAVARTLTARGLQVFVAESSLSSGRQWREQVREAVRSSRSAVLIITHASARSTWVLAEAGAFASQGTPTIVLFDGIEAREIARPLHNTAATAPVDQPERWLPIVERSVAPHRAGRA